MTRSCLTATLALAVAAHAAAFPWLKSLSPPEGAIRQFGWVDPRLSARMKAGMETRMEKRRQGGDSPAGAAFAQTPDGRHLIVAEATGRIDVFDFATGQFDRRLQEPGPEGVRSVAVSPDGRWLACGRTRGDLQLWDLAAGKEVAIFPVRPTRPDREGRGQVERIAFGPDSKVLYTGVDAYASAGNRGATAWEVPSGKRLWNTPVVGYNLAADPRGRWVLTGLIQEEPPRLALLDAATGRVDRSLIIEPGWEATELGVLSVDASYTLDRLFTPDGSRLITIHGDGTVRVWDPEAGKEVTRMKWGPGRSAEPGGLACSPDGRWVAVRNGRDVEIWEVASGRRAFVVHGLEGVPRELAFTRDGRGLVTSSGPTPILWTLKPTAKPPLDGPTDALWETLGSNDTEAAYRLVWALVSDPKSAVRLLVERVRPTDLVLPRARFDQLVAGLDSPRYGDRERAEAELTRAGMAAPAAWVRTALTDARSEEVRTRLARVRDAREVGSPARWRLARAVQVLEMAGTPEAVAVLKEWAAGPAGGFLTDEAAGALARLGPSAHSFR